MPTNSNLCDLARQTGQDNLVVEYQVEASRQTHFHLGLEIRKQQVAGSIPITGSSFLLDGGLPVTARSIHFPKLHGALPQATAPPEDLLPLQVFRRQHPKSYGNLDLVPSHSAVLDVAPYLLDLEPI